ncbi:MAG: ABC transporter substrate-binding protein [Candidatus Thiodiazotropha sp.]
MSTMPNQPKLIWFFAVAAFLLSLYSLRGNNASIPTPSVEDLPGLVKSIDIGGELRVGYGIFPPFTQEDPETRAVSGICVDIMNEVGRQLGVKVVWKRFNWNTMMADLKRGEFDVLADAVFQTPARGRELSFTEPYAYFAIGIGVVRKQDNRFDTFDEINDPKVKVAVGKGFAEETFVRARVPKAVILPIISSSDTAAPINEVITGRADIAIVNLEDAKRFVSANSENLRILWADKPPAFVPAGFGLRFGDLTGSEMLNVSLRNLRSTGVLLSIAKRYGAEANFQPPPL